MLEVFIKIFICCIVYFSHYGCQGANILAIMPSASYSHQVPFRPLWRELLKRGHNLTLVTTDPMRDVSLKNLTEIDMSYAYDSMKKFNVIETFSDDTKSFYEMGLAVKKATNESNNIFFQSPEGQNLIHNNDNHFDLLIVEALLPAMMIFSWRYQIPFIGVSSLDSSVYYHDAAGNPSHPVVNPDNNFSTEKINQMTFLERLTSFIFTMAFKTIIYFVTFPRDRNMLKNSFGEAVPPLTEIQNNMSMLFIATNPIFHPVRPLMPNTITIGNGMHLDPPKSLPKDIQQFLESGKEGVIYFSLGSNIKGNILNDTTKGELVKAFASLPYKVLWKIDEQLPNLPKNVKLGKWFSQQDVLDHSNVKVFITQGGLQSMQESLYFKKPMIGISFFGDQHMNVKRMVHFGYGISVNKYNITKESIREAVLEVMNNLIYTEKAREYGNILRDVDVPNVEKAVWWVEYVIRHKGARHFRNPMLDMPFWKIYMLDIFGFISALFVLLCMALKLMFKVFRCIFLR